MVSKLKKRFWNFIKNARGAILIEFAVCMPILILLLLGLHDIFRMARYQDNTNFVAHEIVQMIQNISQSRSNKKITKEDLEYIANFANYSIYPGKTAYAIDARQHVYGHFPHTQVYYVRGNADGTASCVWRAEMSTSDPGIKTVVGNGKHDQSIVNYAADVTPSLIYPKLTISEGEVKIIVEKFIFFNAGKDRFMDGKKHSVREAFGLYLLTPPVHGNLGYFNSVVIFTPKRGLFDESGPPDASAVAP